MIHRGLLLALILLASVALVGCALPNAASATIVVPEATSDEAAPDDDLSPEPDEDVEEPGEETQELTDEPDDDDPGDDDEVRAGCEGSIAGIPPQGERLAEKYETTADEIMSWFCQGYGFGEIETAYALSKESEKTIGEIFAMREAGMGWGEIKKELGVKVKQGQGCNPHDDDCVKPGRGCNPHDEDCEKPGGGPPDDRGDGNKDDD